LWIGVGVLGAALIVAAVFLLSKKSARELNPEMTTRVLQVPFTQISYPGLSPDGKWVAFPAADAGGKWDIYYMHSGEGEARRITFDSMGYSQQVADISPDGSRIAYNKSNLQTGLSDLFVVSSLGGGGKRIAEGGIIARWRPDGARIGYMKEPGGETRSKSGKLEFWSVGADGADNRLEFADTLSVTANSRYSFCWSADGASIGWLRTNEQLFQSIIIHELATGKERILVGGEERMDDLSWTASNEIIYSSNKSGNTNLWTIPAAGGTPAQITKGSGPDIGMKVSADGRSLVYLQQQRIGNIWVGSFKDGSSRQLTFDERQISSPDYSGDGTKIAFQMTDPDPLKLGSGIYVMDRNGGDRRRLTSEREYAANPRWSPDGKSIAYLSIIRTDSGQTNEVHVIDAANPGTPKNLGKGELWGWLNPNILMVAETGSNFRLLLASADGKFRKQCSGDSTAAIPLLGGKYFVYADLHDTTKFTAYLRKGTGPSLDELLRGPGKIILPSYAGSPVLLPETVNPGNGWNFQNQNVDYIGYWKNPNEPWKYDFVKGKSEPLTVRFTGFIQGTGARTNPAGTELVYAELRLSSKLVMIENLFK
jgi:Tol biopolymer transport system component